MYTRNRYARVLAMLATVASPVVWAEPSADDLQLARSYFDEAKFISNRDAARLWGKTLYGPMMFVDRTTRVIIANQIDTGGKLTARGEVYVGTLPADQSIANTSFNWSGVKWTMIAWPLTADRSSRAALMMHELWHRIQDDLGLPGTNPDNEHLDSCEGRIWMRLEWAALRKALVSKDTDRRSAIEDALTFRAHRRALFPDAGKQEQSLEMHEGLANYTGAALASTDDAEKTAGALRELDDGERKPSFVRSFAYASGPAYGVLLDDLKPDWRKGLTPKNDLGELLAKATQFVAPTDLASAARQRSANHAGDRVTAEETERDKAQQEKLTNARAKLVEGPVLRIPFQKMKIQLDPDNLIPLQELGTVYPTARIVDDWGVLTVTGGALVDKNWSGVTVTAPTNSDLRPLSGPGWTLEISEGWMIAKGARPGDFQIQRKP